MLSPSKILIVNADDFGLALPVNRGIVKCFKEGIVTSTSLLSNGSAFDDAVDLAKSDGLNVGIHLTLMDGISVAEVGRVRSLTDGSGNFFKDYASFSKRYFSSKISLKEVEAEFRAQIEKFLAAGLKPSHINGHNHVHMFPAITDIVIKLMKEYGIKTARVPQAPVLQSFTKLNLNSFAKLFLITFAIQAKRNIKAAGLLSPDHFEGLFASGRLFKSEILRVLQSLKPGVTELMCHPGILDDELAAIYPWNYGWEEEVASLCDQDVRNKIDELGIELSGF
ncbi:MAG: ChbG/HpnK family deacetylase [Nitrospirae bacterium]|nr:ChbG/HpnK family deacetylase [Nitrospirota bacterium]